MHRSIRQGKDGNLVIQDCTPVAPLESDMILVRTLCVAINPNDYKMADNFPTPGLAVGCDFAGTVVALGSSITPRTHNLSVGDKVAGAVHGSNTLRPDVGAFGEYVTAYADCVFRMPEDMDWESAAAIGGAAPGTIGLALVESLQIPGHPENPTGTPFFVLIYGGSTSNGTLASQLLKLAGARCIATCSSRNFDLVKSYGVEAVFDYASPTWVADVRAYTKNNLRYALDIITDTKSITSCYAVLGRLGGRYTGLEMIPDEVSAGLRKTVKCDWVMGLSMSGEMIDLPGGYSCEARPERRAFGKEWFQTIERLVHAGKLRPHPPRGLEGGFQGILEGVDMLRQHRVSGQKLVCML
ncbi:zinc binding enoyl reductase [Lophiotrema nucula]|uniref:Zinc binding enoyl reductase n=1 Tax=Lophiotrema nucula TaxID=690887 RepID=A0A6A5YYK4_9PLEO|nr:zinc binding enoyl reductase [Lophiotrema nucula]